MDVEQAIQVDKQGRELSARAPETYKVHFEDSDDIEPVINSLPGLGQVMQPLTSTLGNCFAL